MGRYVSSGNHRGNGNDYHCQSGPVLTGKGLAEDCDAEKGGGDCNNSINNQKFIL